ncbi:MAG TPA: hypothetical protein VKR59_09945 [Terriglobales bacterium]|nr:hypothetical protein [Terriglobales bacterium]
MKKPYLFGSLGLILLLMATISSAQWIPGTLTSTQASKTYIPCANGQGELLETTYSWSFKDASGATHAFPGTSGSEVWVGGLNCNFNNEYWPLNAWSTDGLFYITGPANTDLSESVAAASGYLNPKYKVMTVTYAPPGGNQYSSVTYGDTDYVGNTSTNGSSFSNNFTFSISVCGATGSVTCSNAAGDPGAGMFGFGGGVAVTGSESNSWTWVSNASNSITISKQTSDLEITPGIPNVYSPVNHDYDIVRVWLNPVTLFTFVPTGSSTGNLYWNGYGYDYNDPLHETDVWPVYVGYLNGDFKKIDGSPCYAIDPTCDPQDADALSRSWVTTQTFASGQGPGLTSADLANICKADPFCANPGYDVTLETGVNPPTTTDQRYTQAEFGNSSPETVPYKQAPPGSTKGETETLSEQYSTTTSQSQGGSYSYQQQFGLEEKFGVSFFWQSLTVDIKQSWTYTWMDTWQNTVTNTSTQTATATITGPPCPSPVSPCVPAFTEPHEFAVYQDNLYGTFMFWPFPYFSISETPAAQTVKAGHVTTFQIPTTANAGYTGKLTSFSVAGLPSGASAGFSPKSGTPGFTSTLTVSTGTSTPAGSYPLTIAATDGSLNYFACIPGGCPMSGEPYGTLVVTAQPTFSMTVSPNSQTIGIGAVTNYTLTTTAANGFSGVIDLNVTGLPPNSSANFVPETITGSGSSTLTITTTGNTPPGTYPLTFTGTSGSLVETATAALVVTGSNFTLSAAPEIQSINAGGNAVYTVTTTAVSGFDGVVSLTLSTLPSGASYTFNPTSITGAGSSTLTIRTSTSTAAGDYPLTITGTSGSLVQTASIELEVNN